MERQLYLGRQADGGAPLYLDPDSFCTHGLILGMTGSGKTGLALALLEEMVEAGVPVLAIDPKGDLPNLGLLFPNFAAEEFQSWTDPGEAARRGVAAEELARIKAAEWKEGLAGWGIDGSRVEALKQRLELRIFTPGSRTLNPVNLLGTFAPPPSHLPQEEQAELASGIVTGLLSLILDNVDPLRDARHVILVQILIQAWSEGSTPTLEELIGQTVDPPFAKVGVFPVDRFLSPDERMKLAMQLNTLAASPTFAAWKEGRPLAIGPLLQSSSDKVPVNIFSLAHLSEKERHFFVGRLMNEVLSWSRTLTGSSSLRAFVYFDEVAGYLPPHPGNPAGKQPMLTLLKQARAVGVGLCLATQNPVDLDYKALSNIGTWMIGRLQTEQDRDRVRDGLLSAAGGLTPAELEAEFSKIKPRTFLLKKAGEDRPTTFRTRWAMSYLRGPVTLAELPHLAPGSLDGVGAVAAPAPEHPAPPLEAGQTTPPPLPRGFRQTFLDPRFVFHARYQGRFEQHREAHRADGTILFRPALHAVLRLRYDEKKGEDFILHQRHHYVAFPLDGGGSLAERFAPLPLEHEDLLTSAPDGSLFAALPAHLDQSEELEQAKKELVGHLFRTLTATRFTNPDLKLYSRPEESREAFAARCAEAADELADLAAVKLQEKLKQKIDRVAARMEKARAKVERLALAEKGKQVEGLWKAGEMLVGLFTKKRRSFSSVLGTSRRALEADARTREAEADVARLQAELLELQEELENGLEALEAEGREKASRISARELRLKRRDIEVERFEVMWVPVSGRL